MAGRETSSLDSRQAPEKNNVSKVFKGFFGEAETDTRRVDRAGWFRRLSFSQNCFIDCGLFSFSLVIFPECLMFLFHSLCARLHGLHRYEAPLFDNHTDPFLPSSLYRLHFFQVPPLPVTGPVATFFDAALPPGLDHRAVTDRVAASLIPK